MLVFSKLVQITRERDEDGVKEVLKMRGVDTQMFD